MAVCYKKLWHILVDRDMDRKDLERVAGISHYAMTQMGKNKDVSTETLRCICDALNVKIEEVVEFIPEEKEMEK